MEREYGELKIQIQHGITFARTHPHTTRIPGSAILFHLHPSGHFPILRSADDRIEGPGKNHPVHCRNDRGYAMMRSWMYLLLAGCTASTFAQTFPVAITIDPSADTARISPYIYGTNGQSNDRGLNITARRLGGNRMTGYNWENNASNMGMDYNQSNANDNYMTWAMGIPANKENIPGITLTTFHDTSVAMGCYSLITLPAAGYVARDKNGTVTAGQVAPSARFRNVVMRKSSSLSTQPDTTDGSVYVDEEVNFLVQRYGSATSPGGVKGYNVDNEPALWPSTHPRIHPVKTRCDELIARTAACGRAVKSVDPNAEVFGGVFYGFNEYYNLQDAPDFSTYSPRGWFVNGFLKALKDSSTVAGVRLMDVIDLHWYPDLEIPVYNDNTDSLTAYTRMQVPRSLWDSSYTEPGWIGTWFSPIHLIPKVQSSIAGNYPGTKLSITEFNYGAPNHISGGIALADVLGIFGTYGVYLATQWGPVEGFQRPAYAVYRNYDGANGRFGDRHIRATNSNVAKASAYAATRPGDAQTMDIILINKDFKSTMQATISIAGSTTYRSARDFGFDGSHPSVTEFTAIPSITGNAFTIAIPPLSVHHLVLSSVATTADATERVPTNFTLSQNYPNPFNPSTRVTCSIPSAARVTLAVYDMLGRLVMTAFDGILEPGIHELPINGSQMASGTYLVRLLTPYGALSRTICLLR
jgi:hypothetical protein